MWAFIALIHEVLEGQISCFLEFDIVLEGRSDNSIHFLLKEQELPGELEWVFQVFLAFHYLSSFLHYEGVHFLDDKLQSGLDSGEDLIHLLELVNFAVVEHELAPCLLDCECFGLILNSFQKNNVDNL